MSNQINYKQKYEELKMKFMESVDAAFRMGFEQGSVQAQQDQMMQEKQAQSELEQAQAGGAPGQGSEGSPAGAEQQADPNAGQVGPTGQPMSESENPAGSELDQHIAKLESMLNKSETSPEDLKKALEDIKSFQVKAQAARVQAVEMKKSYQAIPAIAKALHKPAFKIGVQASHNMNANAKQAVGMQEKIVTDIMKSWAEEEQRATSDISKILAPQILAKKE